MNIGKKRTQETKDKISNTKKEQCKNPEYRKRLSEAQKKAWKEGKYNDRKNMKGRIPWNKGLTGEEYKKHFPNGMDGQFKKGNKLSQEHIETLRRVMKGGNSTSFKKGFKHTEEWKKQNSLRMKGEKHHNFKNWKSKEPYGIEFSNKLKEFIRERNNHTCQECNYTQEQLGYKLHIHHIDYNKRNNNPNNLVPLCRSCHMKTGFNREDWTNYFKEKGTITQ